MAAYLLSFLLFLLAALANGVMDVVDHHFRESIFARIENKRLRCWFEGDWRDHYIDGDPAKGVVKLFSYLFQWEAPGILGRIPTPAPLWDAWHFFKFVMIILLYGAVAVWFPLSFGTKALLFLLFGLGWTFGFHLMYEYLGRQPQYRRSFFRTFWTFGRPGE